MKGLSIIFSCLWRTNLVDSFSPPSPESFDPAGFYPANSKSRDSETTPQSNGVDNNLAESMLASKEPPTHLDPQFPQSQSNVHPIYVRIDQPSTFNDQSNPLEPPQSKDLALDSGDIPSIPFLGSPGSGQMNYGPNILEQLQQLWQHPFDVHKQPEPDCKPRKIPWGVDKVFKMFAMCCGPAPANTGSASMDRVRVSWRRKDCYLCKYFNKDHVLFIVMILIFDNEPVANRMGFSSWVGSPTEQCTPQSIHCCFCKNEVSYQLSKNPNHDKAE